MSHQREDQQAEGRPELPIERGFPIERVNEIVEKESRAKQHYRPIYTMHKWWARRPGSLFRAITLYSLLNDETDLEDITAYEPGENQTLGTNGVSEEDLLEAIREVDMENPETLWEFYPKDVRIKNKKILDPFMGGGTSLVEASRFSVESVGIDLNPVAWFVTKKQLEAGQTDVEELEAAFEQVKEDVAEDIKQYYKTPCPNCDGDHDADVMYYFWVKELDCVSCGHTVPLFKDYRVAKERYVDDPGYHVLCPDCGKITVSDNWEEMNECEECHHEYVPKNGNVSRGGYYNCPECGQKEAIRDAVQDQGKPNERLYGVEYYCEKCDQEGLDKKIHKGYKQAEVEDKKLFEQAKRKWQTRNDLHEYVPQGEISKGAKTVSSEVDGPDVFKHGYREWRDMFNDRQLLALSTLLKSIDSIPDPNAKEYLLLAFSDSLMFQSTFTIYNKLRNNMEGIFRMNSYGPQIDFVENNVWGAKFGRGNFRNTWDKLLSGVSYASSPTDRYMKDGEMIESEEFSQPIGRNVDIYQGDMRKKSFENEYDAVITDPPYYDNIIYSDLSDYFYVWQKIILKDEYPGFDQNKTPRTESIVTNPYLDKSAEDFEHEISEALSVINHALKEDGILAFTYHHSDEESWGELLTSLCENEFEVTATYPINSDLNKFIAGEAVSFDIVIVARPVEERTPISWKSLQRQIVRTAQDTRETLEEKRDLASGDIGVIEMGKCFQEYSKHHGEVHRSGDIMTAKEVVQEIYGIIQESDLGEEDVYLDLLEQWKPTYDDLNKLLRRSNASEEVMREMCLFRVEGNDLVLGDWDDEKRQAYVRTKVDAGNGDLTDLDRAHFLRYRYEEDKSTSEYLERWDTDSLQELCEGLAEATGDDTYLKMLGVDTSLLEFTED